MATTTTKRRKTPAMSLLRIPYAKARVLFSVLKASEGGMSFNDAKAQLEAAGIVDVKRDVSPYVGHHGLTVSAKYARRTSRVLFGGR